MHIVPGSTTILPEPNNEVSNELANVRHTGCSGIVTLVSKPGPVYDDDVAVGDSEEGRGDGRVHGTPAVVIPSVNDHVQGKVAVVVGVSNCVDISMHNHLGIVRIRSENIKILIGFDV